MLDFTPENVAATQKQQEALQTLLSRCVNVKAGFDAMVSRSTPAFRPVAQRFRLTHARQIDHVADMIEALGGTPNVSPGAMAVVNRLVIGLRGLLSRLDQGAMQQIQNGEEYVLGAFDEAIHVLPASQHRADLIKMQKELMLLIDEIDGA